MLTRASGRNPASYLFNLLTRRDASLFPRGRHRFATVVVPGAAGHQAAGKAVRRFVSVATGCWTALSAGRDNGLPDGRSLKEVGPKAPTADR